MKKALYLAPALRGTTTAAIAQQGTPPAGGDRGGQSFEQRKAQMLKRMEERMQAMQKTHDCLAQAQDEKAARACRPMGRTGGPMEGGGMGPGAAQAPAVRAPPSHREPPRFSEGGGPSTG